MSEVSEMIRKMGLFGIGVISMTQEKIEEFSQEMIKKGEMSKDEGKKFVKEVIVEREKQLKDIENKINEIVKENIRKSGLVVKEDIKTLEAKIGDLEKKIQSLTENK